VRKPAPTDTAADDEAKAEMQARIDELQERLQQVELSYEDSQKQSTVLQVKLDEALKEQGLLEENVHEHTERINDLESEKKESIRARREMEQIYESERAAALKEKEDAAAREEEMQLSMQRLKETLSQKELRVGLDEDRKPHLSRQSSTLARSSNPSPSPESFDRQFAPSSIERSDSSSRSGSKLILQKDKLIESLRLELAEAQIKLVEVENMGGGRMQELQRQMYEIKMQNARLMEENESFQLLLSEKTLNGDFLRAPSTTESRPPSQPQEARTTLADELDSQEEGEGGEEVRRLQAEVNGMKDQNKALTLYINNIISRLLQHEQFEQILDKTPDLMAGPGAASRKHLEVAAANKEKELPPSPIDKDGPGGEEGGAGFLQRAKSVIGSRPKPRPQSQIYSGDLSKALPEPLKLNEDPATAPSVPLGRSSSVRSSMGHRRANSEWPAASLVTNMYRGASPAMSPLSPGLSSPTRGTSFFGPGAALRATSGASVPSIAEGPDGKENTATTTTQQRDSKISEKRHSILTESSLDENVSSSSSAHPPTSSHGHPQQPPPRSTPSSPPRSLASSGDKDSKSSGAIMMGSRMRPLRLVQENVDQEDAARRNGAAAAGGAAGNRSSWFGWMNKGLPGMPGLPGGGGAAGSAASTPTTAHAASGPLHHPQQHAPSYPPPPGTGLTRASTDGLGGSGAQS
jgi:hypothetical protein